MHGACSGMPLASSVSASTHVPVEILASASARAQVPFYRTKLTSWMAAFEETYRFILLEADASEHKDWAHLCIEQARRPWCVLPASRCRHMHRCTLCTLANSRRLCCVLPAARTCPSQTM
jgi:hypothetical protein